MYNVLEIVNPSVESGAASKAQDVGSS